ncbi:MAG TPA: cohesin domain-containing protein [Candidatus Saccharimonadia bacterium]
MPSRRSKSKRRIQARQGFNRVAALWLIGLTVMVGVFVVLFSHAAGSGRLYIDPSSTQVLAGATVQVTVREDSDTVPVNAVRADVVYSPTTLDYLGADGTGSAFGVEAPTSTSSGVVSLTRGTITPVTGDEPVVKLTFRVKSGSSAVSIRNTSVLASSTSNTNILGSYDSATLSVLTSTPTPTPAATATATPITITPTPSPTLLVTPTPSPVTTGSGSSSDSNNGSSSNSPASTVTLPAPTGVPANSTTTYTVDGKTVTGNTVDGSSLSDGSHTVTATTTDSSGNVVKQTTSTVNVNTKKSFWQNAALVAKENVPAIVLITLLVIVAIGGIIFYRRNIAGNANTLAWPS